MRNISAFQIASVSTLLMTLIFPIHSNAQMQPKTKLVAIPVIMPAPPAVPSMPKANNEVLKAFTHPVSSKSTAKVPATVAMGNPLVATK